MKRSSLPLFLQVKGPLGVGCQWHSQRVLGPRLSLSGLQNRSGDWERRTMGERRAEATRREREGTMEASEDVRRVGM